jgi:hypothetical protein
MRVAGVVPLRAHVQPDSPLLATIAGPAAKPVAPQRTRTKPVRAVASQATGAGAAAASSRYRGRRR